MGSCEGKSSVGTVLLTRLWLEGNSHPSRIQLCYYLGEVGGGEDSSSSQLGKQHIQAGLSLPPHCQILAP